MEWTVLLLAFLYIVPTIIAYAKQSARAGAIFALNLLLGWTVIGWIVALTWALAAEKNTDASHMKKCPSCAELVQPEAKVCRFCGHSFSA